MVRTRFEVASRNEIIQHKTKNPVFYRSIEWVVVFFKTEIYTLQRNLCDLCQILKFVGYAFYLGAIEGALGQEQTLKN